MAAILTASERRKRLKLKRIVISEHNYLALKKVKYAGDSFNDVISKLLRIYRNYQEKRQQQLQQQDSESSSDGFPFPGSLSELFEQQDRQQIADLLDLSRKRSSRNDQTNKQESK